MPLGMIGAVAFGVGADDRGATRSAGALEHRHDRSESPQQFEDAIRSVRLAAGTLLWQGPRLGFCTLAQPAKRRSRSDQSVSVLTLRSQHRDAKLSPPYLLPFRTLLRLAAKGSPDRFTQDHAEALAVFATRVESIWASSR